MPQLLRRRWFEELATAGATLVIGTHTDLSKLGERVGFEVTTKYVRPLSADEIGTMLDLRLGSVGIQAERFRFSASEVIQIHQSSGGVAGAADVFAHRMLADRIS